MTDHQTLLIDCQVLQTEAWTRGMGRYLTSLIMGIYQNDDHPRVILIFNEQLELSEDCRLVLQKVANKAEQIFLPFQKGLSDVIRQNNVKLLDDFMSQKAIIDAVFIQGSLFSFDYAPAFPTTTRNTCIFYDMIPLKRWSTFYSYFPEQEYFKRFRWLYECETIFAISAAVRKDLISILGFRPEKIINIGGAEIPHFLANEMSAEKIPEQKPYRYILLPGGNSPHKNMLRAIRGFDEFNAEFGDSFRLVITSFYSAENIKRMQALSPNIVLTGDISDSELYALYKGSELLLFPSLDEGLGLPILEAVSYGRKVACSNIPIFNEISVDAFYNFEPEDVTSIKHALKLAICNEDWALKYKAYSKIKQKFTWRSSATSLLAALQSAPLERHNADRRPLSIVVEQAGDIATLQKVASSIPEGPAFYATTLYIDTLAEMKRSTAELPLIFKYFMEHQDICDAPIKHKKSSRAVTVLTQKSSISVAIGLALNASFLGSETIAEQAVERLLTSLQIEETAASNLKKQLIMRVKTKLEKKS